MSISDDLAQGRSDAEKGLAPPPFPSAAYSMGYEGAAPTRGAAAGGGVGPLVLLFAGCAVLIAIAVVSYPFATLIAGGVGWGFARLIDDRSGPLIGLVAFLGTLWFTLGYEQRLAFFAPYRLARHAARLCIFTMLALNVQHQLELEAQAARWGTPFHWAWWNVPISFRLVVDQVRADWIGAIITAYAVLAVYAASRVWMGPRRLWHRVLLQLRRAPDGMRDTPLQNRSQLYFFSITMSLALAGVGLGAPEPLALGAGSALAVIAVGREPMYDERLRKALVLAIPLATWALHITIGIVFEVCYVTRIAPLLDR